MPKIAIIGAGSMVFSMNVIADILAHDALKDAHFALMDIDPERLAVAEAMAKSVNTTRGASATVEATADRRAAIDGADYVINTVGVGGFEATKTDFDVPDRFGVRQVIGDTLGIGGIFRSLRSIPVVLGICRDIEELAPDAQLLTYTNPMATHVLAIARATRVKAVGLCHGVRYTRGRMIMLAAMAEMSPAEIDALLNDYDPHEPHGTAFSKFHHSFAVDEHPEVETLCAGINHMAAFLTFRRSTGSRPDGRNSEDLYPLLHKAYESPAIRQLEEVRLDLFKRLGYFFTETSGHISEYLPWYLHSDDEVRRLGLRPGAYIRTCEELEQTFRDCKRKAEAGEPFIQPDRPVSIEYCSRIINAMETGEPFKFNGNIHNRGGELITNLPGDCCVEVECVADGDGIRPTWSGELPPQCAAMMRTNINVQDLIVRAILEERRDHVYHAAMFDPNTAATLTLPRIHELVDAMITAHGDLMPDFLK
jgi:alpha-galactosidase